MKIENHTKWRTEDLRYMIGQAFKDHGVPSKDNRVTVLPSRKDVTSIANTGKRKPIIKRDVGANMVRAGATIEYGKGLTLRVPNPPRDFDPTSAEHTELVVNVARALDACAVIMAAGTPRTDWSEKPIAWLSDWFEVHRGPKGQAADARVSPLMPAEVKTVDELAELRDALEHASAMAAKWGSRKRAAETREKKWNKKVRRLMRLLEKKQ